MTASTLVPPVGMTMTQEKAFEILDKLIAAVSVAVPTVGPDGTLSRAFSMTDVPTTWASIIGAHAAAFPAPVAVVETKKKRKKYVMKEGSQQGWPLGITRAEYKEWKAIQEANGVTEGLNPHVYKAQRDGTATTNVPTENTGSDNQALIEELVNTPAEPVKGKGKNKPDVPKVLTPDPDPATV